MKQVKKSFQLIYLSSLMLQKYVQQTRTQEILTVKIKYYLSSVNGEPAYFYRVIYILHTVIKTDFLTL